VRRRLSLTIARGASIVCEWHRCLSSMTRGAVSRPPTGARALRYSLSDPEALTNDNARFDSRGVDRGGEPRRGLGATFPDGLKAAGRRRTISQSTTATARAQTASRNVSSRRPERTPRVSRSQTEPSGSSRRARVVFGGLIAWQEKPSVPPAGAPPVLTEVQKLQLEVAAQQVELWQLRAPSAQTEYEKAGVVLRSLVAKFTPAGYTMTDRFDLVPVPPQPLPTETKP
jgi:hypothetical protein